jgi:hypothetical protein
MARKTALRVVLTALCVGIAAYAAQAPAAATDKAAAKAPAKTAAKAPISTAGQTCIACDEQL